MSSFPILFNESDLFKKNRNARFGSFLIGDLMDKAWAQLGLSRAARSKINPVGTDDDHMYCIANDWRSRDWKAKKFRTMTNCRFSLVLTNAFRFFSLLKKFLPMNSSP